MKVVPSEPNYGPSGAAVIRINKTAISVVFDSGDQFQFDPKTTQLPKFVVSGKKYAVGLSSQADKIFSIRPLDGKFRVTFKKFLSKEGQPPVAKRKTKDIYSAKTGRSFNVDKLQFTALLQADNGAEFILPLMYKDLKNGNGFSATPDGVVYIKGGSRDVQRLTEFLEVTGVLDAEIPFSDNILPTLERLVQKREKEFDILVKDGWIDTIQEAVATKVDRVRRNGK